MMMALCLEGEKEMRIEFVLSISRLQEKELSNRDL
jgi:hypothetical protein